MANEYYEHTSGVPADLSRGTSVLMRQEFDKLEAGMDKLPPRSRLATNSTGFVNDTGGVNAFVLTGVPNVTALVTGMEFRFKAVYANSGSSTINVNGIGVKPVVRSDGQPLEIGDVFAGQIVSLIYDDVSGGRFQYTSSAASATASARAYAQEAAQSSQEAGVASGLASASAANAGISAGNAATSEAAAAVSALAAANSAGSIMPGYLEMVRITTNTVGLVDKVYECAAAGLVLTAPTPNQAIAGRLFGFVNTSGITDQANAPTVNFGTAQLNRGASPGAMKLVTGETRYVRVTGAAPWGWIKE